MRNRQKDVGYIESIFIGMTVHGRNPNPPETVSSRLTFGLPREAVFSISKPNHPTVRSLLHAMMFRCLYPGEF